jgi:hypothetical protein
MIYVVETRLEMYTLLTKHLTLILRLSVGELQSRIC